jgi:hypothetical protein
MKVANTSTTGQQTARMLVVQCLEIRRDLRNLESVIGVEKSGLEIWINGHGRHLGGWRSQKLFSLPLKEKSIIKKT